MYYYDRYYQGRGLKKKSLRGLLFRYFAIFIGILVVASIFQFGVWAKGSEIVQKICYTFTGGIDNGGVYIAYLEKALGLDHFFIPDLWPLDNESIWDSFPY